MIEIRSRAILTRARSDPQFRDRLIQLGALRDQFTYPSVESWMGMAPALFEFAHDAGLLEQIDSQASLDEQQAQLDELAEKLLEEVDELAFYAKPVNKLPPAPAYRQPVGKVFLSWTVKNPRGRESMQGIRKALDHFNVGYFDYTEHQLDDSRDMSAEIVQQMEEAIRSAAITIEAVSSAIGSYWLQWERERIKRSHVALRVFVGLEMEVAAYTTSESSGSGRVIRIDMSGGRSAVVATEHADRWMAAESETGYYRSEDFYFRCFDLIWNVRRQLDQNTDSSWFARLRDKITYRRPREAVAFLRRAMEQ